MSRWLGALWIAVLVSLVLVFAALNGGERVTLRLAFLTLYRVPLVAVAFGGFFFGMVAMLVAGVRSDLKVRRILQDRLLGEAREEQQERVDRLQQDLFQPNPDESS